MGPMAAAELPNTAVGGIQRGPQRIFVIDMFGQTERDGVFRKLCGRSDKIAKVVDRHDGVDRRDHRRRADQSANHDLEASVGRRCRAHNQVEIEISGMVAEPLPAIVACLR